MARDFALDPMLLVVSARPPHRGDHRPASPEHRLAMLELLCRDHPELSASDVEIRRPGPSYMVDTVTELGRSWPDHAPFLVMGIDAWVELDSWHRAADLLAMTSVIVTTRPGHRFGPAQIERVVAARQSARYDPDIGCWVHRSKTMLAGWELETPDVSASRVRREVGAARSIDDLTGPAVAAYIHRHGLYRADSTPSGSGPDQDSGQSDDGSRSERSGGGPSAFADGHPPRPGDPILDRQGAAAV